MNRDSQKKRIGFQERNFKSKMRNISQGGNFYPREEFSTNEGILARGAILAG